MGRHVFIRHSNFTATHWITATYSTSIGRLLAVLEAAKMSVTCSNGDRVASAVIFFR